MIGEMAGVPARGVVVVILTDEAASVPGPGGMRERAIECEIEPGTVPGVC